MDSPAHRLQERFENDLARALLEQNRVSRTGLEQALDLQVIAGGHLATSLWDLGLVEPAISDRISGDILRLPSIAAAALDELPAEVIDLVPTSLIQKVRMLPFCLEGRVLRVASCEPWDLAVIEQLAQHTDCQVACTFLGEVPLARLLHRHYGVPIPARILLGPQTRADEDAADKTLPRLSEDLMSEEAFFALYTNRSFSLAGATLPEIELAAEDEVKLLEGLEPLAGVDEARRLLERADSRHAVGDVLTRFAVSRGNRVVLLVRQRAVWVGWTGAGEGIDPRALHNLIVPSEAGTIFGLVGETGAPFVGPLAPHRIHLVFTRALGGLRPRSVGLFPIHYRGKIVFGVYLDAGESNEAPPDMGDIVLLAQQAPGVLERALKRRLDAAQANDEK